jgi:hypothetical protein
VPKSQLPPAISILEVTFQSHAQSLKRLRVLSRTEAVSDEPKGYTAPAGFLFGPADFVVTESGQDVLVVARSFDSRWHWDAARTASPLIPKELNTEREVGVAFAQALQQTTHADFAFRCARTNTSSRFLLGTTRLANIRAYFQYDPAWLMDLTGKQLLDLRSQQNGPAAPKRLARLPDFLNIVYPAIDPAKVELQRQYRSAILLDNLFLFSHTYKLDPSSFRMTGLEAADILDRFFLSKE